MDITVMLEPVDSRGYRATAWTPAPFVAEGASREDALNQLRTLMAGRLRNVEFVHLTVPAPREAHTWDAIIGKMKNHPDAAEVDENIREYRRQKDQDLSWG